MAILNIGSFAGGVHPPEFKKLTEKKPIEKLPIPPLVVIPIQQHIGAPSKPVVEKGMAVCVGDLVSEASGFVSVPSHASISGTVTAVENRPHPLGPEMLSVVIESDGQDTWADGVTFQNNYLDLSISEMLQRIRNAGLAGMGGAAFPTHVKLAPPADKQIDTLVINGAECEPYLTADHQLMLEAPEKILLGMQIMMKVVGAQRGIIGVENNKPDAIRVLRDETARLDLPYKVVALHVKYPQGAEKQLLKSITGRTVPSGGLPMDIGCVVQNVGTSAAVYDAVAYKRPLVERVVTVTGKGIGEPKNVMARIGTLYSFIFEQCGGINENAGKIIMGGPMMGLAQSTIEAPVIKGTSGLLVLSEKESRRREGSVCISCGRCVHVCPMGLMPKMLAGFVKHGRLAEAESYHVLDCIECGSCAFVCPAHINLVHLIKYGKSEVIRSKKKAS